MLQSVFFLNFELFGVGDMFGERITVFSVGNVEVSYYERVMVTF